MSSFNNLEQLKSCSNLFDIVKSDYYHENFYKKYVHDIPLFALEMFDIELTWQQAKICGKIDYLGGRLAVPSGHGIGKTALEAIISIHFILLHEQSINRYIAPKISQITKFVFKEISAKLSAMQKPREVEGNIVYNKWGFLSNFFIVNATLIYIKGFQTSWYIEPATAPKNEGEKLSGQHNRYYLLILEEASGIEDSHIEGSLGAVSEEFACVLAFSQHTKNIGYFNDFVRNKSKVQGGVWDVVRCSSLESPLVSNKAIKDWKNTFTDDQYRIRVLGLYGKTNDGNLLSDELVEKVFTKKDWVDNFVPNNNVLSVDVAVSGFRDKSVRLKMQVRSEFKNNKDELYIVIKEIQIPKINKRYLKPTAMANNTIQELYKMRASVSYNMIDNATILWDANTIGNEAFDRLESKATEVDFFSVFCEPITWGSKGRMQRAERSIYLNERAKAYWKLKELIDNDRVYCSEEVAYAGILKKELMQLPFVITSGGLIKMVAKKDTSFKSPDIADCLAQVMLGDYPQIEARATGEEDNDSDIEYDIQDFLDDDMDEHDEVETETFTTIESY